jgi:DNA-binding MarR family transcriptional regulator
MLGFRAVRHLFALRQWSKDNPPFSPSPDQEPVDALDPTQRTVLEFITSHPGVHLREICRGLALAMGAVQYHVRRLERDGRISSMRRGLYKFFYPADLFGERQRDVLSVLSLDRPRELLNIIEHPGSTQEALAEATDVSQPTVSWHLKRLIDLELVDRHQDGRVITYSIVGGGAEMAAFIKTYHPTVWERWSSRLADIFIAYAGEEKK